MEETNSLFITKGLRETFKILEPIEMLLIDALGSRKIGRIFQFAGYLSQILCYDHIRDSMDVHNFKVVLDHLLATQKGIEAQSEDYQLKHFSLLLTEYCVEQTLTPIP